MTHTSVDHHAATGERSVDEGARRDLYDAEDDAEGKLRAHAQVEVVCNYQSAPEAHESPKYKFIRLVVLC